MEFMSYINTPLDFELKYFTVPERLEVLANNLVDKEVYVFISPDGKRESITAIGLYTKSKGIAKFLCTLGVNKGDVVVSCLPNNLESLICTFGIICAGGIVLNTIITRTKAEDIEDALIRTNAKCLILEPGNDEEDLKACLNFIEIVQKNGCASSKTASSLQFLLSTTTADCAEVLCIKDGFDISEVDLPQIDPDDYAVMFSTSGSSGIPKFVPQSHHSVMITGYHLEESMLFEPDDIIYCERRMAWIGGFPYMYLHNGAKTVTKTAPFATLREHCMFTIKTMENERCNIAGLL